MLLTIVFAIAAFYHSALPLRARQWTTAGLKRGQIAIADPSTHMCNRRLVRFFDTNIPFSWPPARKMINPSHKVDII